MRRTGLVLVSCLTVWAADLPGQAVPEGSQATRVQTPYRRTPNLRVDPFRHVMIPHWGLVLSAGGVIGNNVLNVKDIRALIYLNDNDEILIPDIMDAFALVPDGEGVQVLGQAEGGAHLGGPFGSHVSFGLSAQAREYGAGQVNDDAAALLRDGNVNQQTFSLGETQGSSLTTGEAGAHAVLRFGPLGSEDGVMLSFGFGGRYVRPLFYAHAETTIDSRLYVAADSVSADVEVTTLSTPDLEVHGGSGIVGDFLLRLEWPTSGLALEALVANLGKVNIEGVERRVRTFSVATTSLLEIKDSLDASDFTLVGTEDVEVTLPRIVRFTASAWANSILQLDVSASTAVGGELRTPVIVDIGSTWRLSRTLPLRLGLVLGGHQRIGFTAGFAVESRNLYWQVAAGSLGGLFQHATGAAARFELGFFF